MANGDYLALFEIGETFVDPDTGEVLGSESKEVGRIVVTAAEPKFSKARIYGEPFEVSVGSVLKRPAVIEVAKGKVRQRKRSGKKL